MLEVKEDFLDTMHIPLLAGRSLSGADRAGAARVVVGKEAFGKLGFGEENPLGRRFKFGEGSGTEFEIVGIARNARYGSLRGEIPATVYLPFAQHMDALDFSANGMAFGVRTVGEPALLVPAIRGTLRDIDSNLALVDITT